MADPRRHARLAAQREERIAEARAGRLAEEQREARALLHADDVCVRASATTEPPPVEALVDGFRVAAAKALARLLAELDSPVPIEPERLAKIAGECIRLSELLSGRATDRREDATPPDPRTMAAEVVDRLEALGFCVVAAAGPAPRGIPAEQRPGGRRVRVGLRLRDGTSGP